MIRWILTPLFLAVVLLGAGAQTPFPSESGPLTPRVNSAELISKAEEWDGRELIFEGEAIGPLMRRGEHVWINVLDANAAMGIFLSSDTARAIGNFGSYERKGDTLRVRGVFNRACPDHGGDMDIHASSVAIITAGKPTPHPIDGLTLALMPAFLFLAAFLFIVWRRRKTGAPSQRLTHES
jgi:hypothetical protein